MRERASLVISQTDVPELGPSRKGHEDLRMIYSCAAPRHFPSFALPYRTEFLRSQLLKQTLDIISKLIFAIKNLPPRIT